MTASGGRIASSASEIVLRVVGDNGTEIRRRVDCSRMVLNGRRFLLSEGSEDDGACGFLFDVVEILRSAT